MRDGARRSDYSIRDCRTDSISARLNGRQVTIRIRDGISNIKTDIDLDAKWEARDADASVAKCIAAVTDSLKSPTSRFSEVQRAHLHQVLLSLRHGHLAIRELLRPENEQALSVNVMPIVRTQIETLYAICLIIENPDALTNYEKDGWKKLFVRHLAMREECCNVPRVTKGLAEVEEWLEKLRILSGVSDMEKQTVEAQELAKLLHPGTAPAKISAFPTPAAVVDRIVDPDRKRMLMRLYPEYQFLCGFVHFSPATVTLTSLLDCRQPFRAMFSTGQITETWHKEIADPAIWLDMISVIECCCEFLTVYPNDVELARCCVEAWKPLTENTFIGRAIWQLRTRKLLGAIS